MYVFIFLLGYLKLAPSLPAVVNNDLVIFGSNYICRYFFVSSADNANKTTNDMTVSERYLDLEEFELLPLLKQFEQGSSSSAGMVNIVQLYSR